VRYTPHEGDVTFLPLWRPVQAKSLKMASVLLTEEKISYKMVCYTLYLS